MAAEYLQSLGGRYPCIVSQEGLDDRCEQCDFIGRLTACGLIWVIQFAIDQQRHIGGEGATSFRICARRQQHATHIRVNDDGVSRCSGGALSRQAASLLTLARIRQRVLIRDFGQAQRLHAHAQTRRIHHHEHRIQALMRLADQPADRIIQIDLTGRIPVDTHLALNGTTTDRIAHAGLARSIRQALRHDEQGYTARARRCIWQARQHEVHDIFCQIVLTSGNENFVPTQPIAAVFLWLGPSAQQTQIGTAMRLGQTHGARPFAGHQFG